MAKVQFENGTIVEFDGNPTESDIEDAAEQLGIKPTAPSVTKKQNAIDRVARYVLPNLDQTYFPPDKYNLYGDIANRIPAALRSAVSVGPTPKGTLDLNALVQGFQHPSQVPTFQQMAYNALAPQTKNPVVNYLGALPPTMAGTALDIATNPWSWITGLGAKAIQPEMGNIRNVLGQGAMRVMESKPVTSVIRGTENLRSTAINLPNKALRGGLTPADATRIETTYGSSNGSLVDVIKHKLNQTISYADNEYNRVFQNTPENKFINVKPAIDEAGKRLQRLGLITEKGNLTELGKSEIAKDSVYGKLLDFYQSADAISGVEALQGKALTQAQMIKAFRADRETLVNKDQYLFLRDKLNSLYKNKPSDIDVSRVVDRFYQSGEDSGLKGLQAARRLEREAFAQEAKFLNKNTGDLKIATERNLNRIGTDKPLSKQEADHIIELQKYIKHPIIQDAAKINKLNRARDILTKIKQYGKGAVGTIAIGEVGRKIATGKW